MSEKQGDPDGKDLQETTANIENNHTEHLSMKRPNLVENENSHQEIEEMETESTEALQPATKRKKLEEATTQIDQGIVQNDARPDSVELKENSIVDQGSKALSAAVASDSSEDTCASSKTVDDDKSGDGASGNKEQNKENIAQEQGPIDLSKGKVNGTSDIIMLSDDDDEDRQLNGFVNSHVEISPEKMVERRKMIKHLQEELRNEEAKLVLLKKLRQSQMLGHIQDSNQAKAPPQRPSQNAPPPLVCNSQNARPAHSRPPVQTQYNSRGNQPPQGPQSHAPPPLVMGPRGSAHQPSAQQQIRHSSSTGNLQNYRPSQPAQPQPQQQQQAPQQPEQTPAQRQAAAKLALRKQLEKTLLQIPPPKPPPPEMNFIPSLASGEFVMMCGLEEIVTFIKETDARKKGEATPDVKYVFNPFICVQCKTDFTPVWKREKPGSKNVICENCVTSNQKKALKQEHTNRLKSAFVKALQQEQEIEQKIQQQQQQQQQRQQNSTPATTTHSQPQQQAPPSAHSVRSGHPSNVSGSSRSIPGSYKSATDSYLAHQNMIQAHQASLRGVPMLQGFNPRAMFPYGQPPKSVSDLQRQYLLDMIPRSMPQGMWKNQ